MTNAEKVRENALRREAKSRGLLLIRSTRVDPTKFDYGRYVLVDNTPENAVRGGPGYVRQMFLRGEGKTTEEIEKIFEQPSPQVARRPTPSQTDLIAALRDVQSKYGGYLTEDEERAFVTVRRALASVAEAVK